MTLPLRPRAEALSGALPPLMARAQHLAAGITLGGHGRRRPGHGDSFWQFRPARPGDPAQSIDWRRSARSDTHFVQEKEWQAAQTVLFWSDRSAAMQFASDAGGETKAQRAALLTLATAILLARAGERVGLTDLDAPPSPSNLQLSRMAEALDQPEARDYGAPGATPLPAHARAVFLSDFLGPLDALEAALARATNRGVSGALVQVLDPAEEAFPFEGRTIFQSMRGEIGFETRHAGGLRMDYQQRLAARKTRLQALAHDHGWQYHLHHSTDAPANALLWLYRGLEARL
jgi:uncharacterized protein (DUF58 family)